MSSTGRFSADKMMMMITWEITFEIYHAIYGGSQDTPEKKFNDKCVKFPLHIGLTWYLRSKLSFSERRPVP